MNRELALLIQSYVDGELSGRQKRRVQDWLETDAEARALYTELSQTRAVLVEDAELERVLPESPDFYWSKIRNEIDRIEQEEALEPAEAGWLARWRAYLAPVAATALIVLLAIPAFRYWASSPEETLTAHLAQVETPDPDVGAISYRSGNMFVVWLTDNSTPVSEAIELEASLE